MRPKYKEMTDRIINELMEAQNDLFDCIDDLESFYEQLNRVADEEETFPDLDELDYGLQNLQETIRILKKARNLY